MLFLGLKGTTVILPRKEQLCEPKMFRVEKVKDRFRRKKGRFYRRRFGDIFGCRYLGAMDAKRNTFPLLFEAMIWLLYAGLYKYAYFLQQARLPNPELHPFPWPQLLVYALLMTIYVIPFYRGMAPALLKRRKYGLLALFAIIYFVLLSKLSTLGINWIFLQWTTEPVHSFYRHQFRYWDLQLVLTDWIAFMSLAFASHAFAAERAKRLLEKEHFRLQVEALKAQLNPHFLFNMLNSIYGMSLAGSPDTPNFILRMSDMMRYILYDGKEVTVPLEKDLQFLENYIEMEKKRYPEADIRFHIENNTTGKMIVPLLLIPFIENSFKHGAHRVTEKGVVEGSVIIRGEELHLRLLNDILPAARKPPVGGVGLANVQKRLDVYYPGRYSLAITPEKQFSVHLTIQLKKVHV